MEFNVDNKYISIQKAKEKICNCARDIESISVLIYQCESHLTELKNKLAEKKLVIKETLDGLKL